MRTIGLTMLMVLYALGGAATASTDKKWVALVIGNSDYATAPLKNPRNDAADMARELRSVGFEVMHSENLDQPRMRAAIREFGRRLRKSDVGLFYFAGHGMQVEGENFLIPVGTDIREEDEVRDQAVAARLVTDKMASAGNPLNIVVLDACRNNPFTRSFRSASRGLARMQGPTGTLVAYATAPGQVSYDGDGRNGVYTKHLLANISVPGLTIEQVFRRVRNGVRAETGDKQTPWESSSLLGGDFHFVVEVPIEVQVPAPAPAQPSALTQSLEISFWESVRDSDDAAMYSAYLNEYPKGHFASLARLRLKQLQPTRTDASSAAKQTAPKLVVTQVAPTPVKKLPPEPSGLSPAAPKVLKPEAVPERLQTAPMVVAKLVPAKVVDAPLSAADDKYRIAVLPWELINDATGFESEVARGVGQALRGQGNFVATHAYSRGLAQRLSAQSPGGYKDLVSEVWAKKSNYILGKPNEVAVFELADRLGVDGVLMYAVDLADENAYTYSVAMHIIYLADLRTRKIYAVEENRANTDTGVDATTVNWLTERALKEFRQNTRG